MGRKRRNAVRSENVSMDLKDGAAVKPSVVWGVVFMVLVLIAALIPFCQGKYIEFNTNDAFDGGLNVYSAESIVRGEKLNVDVFPSARYGTLLVNVVGVALFGYSEFGPKLIQLVMQVWALGLMFYTVRKVFGLIPAGVALVMASFYLSCPPYLKFGNVKEQFMIVCMIMAACGVMIHHSGGKWWWLLVSGVGMINVYYFKQTGLSVVAAVIVYHFVQPLFRRCSWWRYGRELVLLSAGAVVGLVPLAMFQLWQGTSEHFFKRFPANIVLWMFLCFCIYYFGFAILMLFGKKYGEGFTAKVRGFHWRSIALGFVLCTVGLVIFVVVSSGPGSMYRAVAKIPVVGYPFLLVRDIENQVIAIYGAVTGAGRSYIAGSRRSSVFATQYVTVFGYYYQSFIVPIAMGFVGLIWWLVRSVVCTVEAFNKKAEAEDNSVDVKCDSKAAGPDRFVLLLGLWWILDMLFVWISPRSYVQYYLPFNASAAMLAGYVVYKCLQKDWGWVAVLAGWFAADVIIGVGIKDTLFTGEDATSQLVWSFVPKLVLVILGFGIWFGCRKLKLKKLTSVAIGLLCFVGWFFYNQGNLKQYSSRVDSISQAKANNSIAGWEALSHYIRDNTTEEDGIYVWGWTPGIYVQSERFSPAKKMVAYGNMHTDSPEAVSNKIQKLLAELQADPPKYIVDTQKIHYPFYEHPVFDLWPCWEVNSSGGRQFHFRIYPNQVYEYRQTYTLDELNRLTDIILLPQVKEVTRLLLVNPNRKGGAVPEERAEELAEQERLRHEAMLPLRQFVMGNYKLSTTQVPEFVLFERK